MATATQTLILDDIDGSEGATTVVFGLDGATYEIDLSPENEANFRQVLDRMVAVARRTDGKGKGRKPSASKPANSEASKIREWARANGHEVGERGRIQAEIVEAYQAANPQA